MKKVFIVLAPFVVIYLVIGMFLYVKQRSFLYHPTPQVTTKYNTLLLENEKEKINIIVLNEGHQNSILYFGGNGESMGESADYIAAQFPNFTVYLMDYRGYGSSSGEASETGLYSDALALYDRIKDKHEKISVGGRSLGSAIAVYVAAHREVSKLALITPFDSIVNIAQERYPIYPVNLLLHDSYDAASQVNKIRAKTFIVIAQNDKVVSRERTQKLIDTFSKDLLYVDIIKNRGHNDISSDNRYYKIMQDFIGEG